MVRREPPPLSTAQKVLIALLALAFAGAAVTPWVAEMIGAYR